MRRRRTTRRARSLPTTPASEHIKQSGPSSLPRRSPAPAAARLTWLALARLLVSVCRPLRVESLDGEHVGWCAVCLLVGGRAQSGQMRARERSSRRRGEARRRVRRVDWMGEWLASHARPRGGACSSVGFVRVGVWRGCLLVAALVFGAFSARDSPVSSPAQAGAHGHQRDRNRRPSARWEAHVCARVVSTWCVGVGWLVARALARLRRAKGRRPGRGQRKRGGSRSRRTDTRRTSTRRLIWGATGIALRRLLSSSTALVWYLCFDDLARRLTIDCHTDCPPPPPARCPSCDCRDQSTPLLVWPRAACVLRRSFEPSPPIHRRRQPPARQQQPPRRPLLVPLALRR